jgi:hypothetical protein
MARQPSWSWEAVLGDKHNLGYRALGEQIECELSSWAIFIVIVSPASVDSAWVRRDVETAVNLRDGDLERINHSVLAEKTGAPPVLAVVQADQQRTR